MSTRAPLVEEDKVFLQRLEPARKRCTFASYVFDEIRGIKWRREQYKGLKATNPAYILQEVMDRIRTQIERALERDAWHQDTEERAQWYEAMILHEDEALQYIGWCLAWEQRSKIEKRAHNWRQYQAYQQSRGSVSTPDVSDDLTPIVEAFARETYGPLGALEHPWHELQDAYFSAHGVWST